MTTTALEASWIFGACDAIGPHTVIIFTNKYRLWDGILTVVNVASSIAVAALGSAYWIVEANNATLNVFLSLFGICIVITSVVQYIFDYRTRWKTHERAAASYATLNRELEELYAAEEMTNEDLAR